jgi:hypothetical protein
MAQPFSEKTEELLERAQRAIERSIELREQTKRDLVGVERRLFQMHEAFRRHRSRVWPVGAATPK